MILRNGEVGPTQPCDRCEHPMRRHLGPRDADFLKRGSRCAVPKCWCDGYVIGKMGEMAQ